MDILGDYFIIIRMEDAEIIQRIARKTVEIEKITPEDMFRHSVNIFTIKNFTPSVYAQLIPWMHDAPIRDLRKMKWFERLQKTLPDFQLEDIDEDGSEHRSIQSINTQDGTLEKRVCVHIASSTYREMKEIIFRDVQEQEAILETHTDLPRQVANNAGNMFLSTGVYQALTRADCMPTLPDILDDRKMVKGYLAISASIVKEIKNLLRANFA